MTPERLAEITARRGDMIGPFVQQIRPYRGNQTLPVSEVAARVGIDAQLFERIWTASGFRDQRFASEDDVEALGLIKSLLAAGIPEDVVIQLVRVLAESLGKVADAGSRLLHLYVHEQLRSAGAVGADALATSNAISGPLIEVAEPAVLYFLRQAVADALREDMMLHLMEDDTAPASVPGQFGRVVMFVDLSGFTPLTEAMGDEAAADVVRRFAELVRQDAPEFSGQVVKQIGDEFMLVFPDGRLAVACGLAIRARTAAEPRFPALRIGGHAGPVLYRDGEPVELYEVETADGVHRRRAVDPVCGMEIDDGSADAKLTWQGRRMLFCSDGCLRSFLEHPERYDAIAGDAFEPTR